MPWHDGRRVVGALDGVRVPIARSENPFIEHETYNGEKGWHMMKFMGSF